MRTTPGEESVPGFSLNAVETSGLIEYAMRLLWGWLNELARPRLSQKIVGSADRNSGYTPRAWLPTCACSLARVAHKGTIPLVLQTKTTERYHPAFLTLASTPESFLSGS